MRGGWWIWGREAIFLFFRLRKALIINRKEINLRVDSSAGGVLCWPGSGANPKPWFTIAVRSLQPEILMS